MQLIFAGVAILICDMNVCNKVCLYKAEMFYTVGIEQRLDACHIETSSGY